jgi:CBS domain-containing protein
MNSTGSFAMTKAKDIMTSNPVTCRDTDSVYDAVQIMKQRNTGVVPIVDQNDQCCGIITDRDICMQVILNSLDPKSTRLQSVMTKELLTCKPDDDINQVLAQMESRQVKRMIVTDENNRCVGIISEADIVQRMPDRGKVGELAAGIYS